MTQGGFTPLAFAERPLSPPSTDWPEYGLAEDLLPALSNWARDGLRAALATLCDIQGSSPRPVGSEMAIAETGEMAGYVSGGCVEASVAAEALASLQDGKLRTLDYGAGSPVLDIQLTCGGRIGILVRPIEELALYVSQLTRARQRRQVVSVLTDRRNGAMRIVDGFQTGTAAIFARVHTPPVRLVLSGGDPVTLALLRLAPFFGMDPFLLRPSGPPTPPPGLSAGRYDRRPYDDALAALSLDRWCAVYALNHDADLDHRLALHALTSEAFCVGILGSRSKSAGRVAALRRAGVPDETLAQLHLPAGLDLAARTPMEIALSIFAQILRQRP